ncbi:hypothetical protein SAMN05443247_01203 [Bradyrhizobium erythrophlei]|nr:hypothetical protein SAMN05443247_01203 [Bradyrhizobium erythrophlei]
MSVSDSEIEIGVWIFPDHANVRHFYQSVARRQILHAFTARPLLYRRATSVIWRGTIWRSRLRRLAAAANVSYLAIDIRVVYQGSAERQRSMQKFQRGAAGGGPTGAYQGLVAVSCPAPSTGVAIAVDRIAVTKRRNSSDRRLHVISRQIGASDNQTNQRAARARRMRPIKPAAIRRTTPIIHQDATMYSKLRRRGSSNTKA